MPREQRPPPSTRRRNDPPILCCTPRVQPCARSLGAMITDPPVISVSRSRRLRSTATRRRLWQRQQSEKTTCTLDSILHLLSDVQCSLLRSSVHVPIFLPHWATSSDDDNRGEGNVGRHAVVWKSPVDEHSSRAAISHVETKEQGNIGKRFGVSDVVDEHSSCAAFSQVKTKAEEYVGRNLGVSDALDEHGSCGGPRVTILLYCEHARMHILPPAVLCHFFSGGGGRSQALA